MAVSTRPHDATNVLMMTAEAAHKRLARKVTGLRLSPKSTRALKTSHGRTGRPVPNELFNEASFSVKVAKRFIERPYLRRRHTSV